MFNHRLDELDTDYLEMKELRDIIRAFDAARTEGKKMALATVVHVEGSSYRQPGARMLITETGQLTGAISGGCLEGDALRKALLVMTMQVPMLVTYDTMDDDDTNFGVGLGCNGIIQILIEPIDPAQPNHPIELLRSVAMERQKTVVITLFSMANRKNKQPGTCLLLDEKGRWTGDTAYPLLTEALQADALQALRTQTSCFKNYTSPAFEITAFIEFIPPPITIVVIGAGNDILPLLDIADVLGWETKVVDGRPNYAQPARFVKACQVLTARPEQVLDHISIDDFTCFALMTHNYNYDKAILQELCRKNARFIGLLGPKKKTDRMLNELAEAGFELTEQNRAAIYGPVGLDIGAETPEEIALSIIAEIKAALYGKTGHSLREKDGVLHARNKTQIIAQQL